MSKAISGFIVAGLFIIMLASSVVAEHQWYNGYVREISMGSIKVDDDRYEISPKVRVVQHVMEKGIIYERPAKPLDVVPGNRVTIKIEGVVTEIIIERYH